MNFSPLNLTLAQGAEVHESSFLEKSSEALGLTLLRRWQMGGCEGGYSKQEVRDRAVFRPTKETLQNWVCVSSWPFAAQVTAQAAWVLKLPTPEKAWSFGALFALPQLASLHFASLRCAVN